MTEGILLGIFIGAAVGIITILWVIFRLVKLEYLKFEITDRLKEELK